MKTCGKCGEDKEPSMFHKDKTKRDGLASQCRTCRKAYITEWYQANSESVIERQRANWLAASPEKKAVKAGYAAAYGKANKERRREQARAYQQANKARRAATTARYRDAHRGRVRAAASLWQSRNRDKSRVNDQNRRAAKLRAGGRLSKGLAQKLFALQRGRCACCSQPLGASFHLDHILPLALGGANVDENIQLLRPLCNQQKNKKHPIDFMRQRGMLL